MTDEGGAAAPESAWLKEAAAERLMNFWPSETLTRWIRMPRKRGRLADVGCGVGGNMLAALLAGYEVYGLDISPYAVRVAAKRAKRLAEEFNAIQKAVAAVRLEAFEKLVAEIFQAGAVLPYWEVRGGDARSLPWPDGHFAVVLCLSLLQHMDAEGRTATMAEVARVLESEGRALFSFMKTSHAGTRHESEERTVYREESGLRELMHWFTWQEVSDLLGGAGLAATAVELPLAADFVTTASRAWVVEAKK